MSAASTAIATVSDAAYRQLAPQQKLAVARLKARTLFPYFSSALFGLIPVEKEGLGTLGVTEKLVLLWDPAVVDKWDCEYLVGVLIHEINHVLRAHFTRFKILGVQPGTPESKLANVAGDLEINDDLLRVFPKCFVGTDSGALPKFFHFPNGLTMEEYYTKLREVGDQIFVTNTCCGEKIMAGKCGSAGGNAVDGENEGKAEGDGDGEENGRSEGEIERIRQSVAQQVSDYVSKGRGNIPQGLQRWASAFLKPPKIRWQDKLARVMRGAFAWKAGKVDLKYSHISRRQWGIGFGKGKPILPAYRAPVPSIACAVDTSGSMSAEDLSIALREIKGVIQAVGSKIMFCSCDAAVHEMKMVSNWKELPDLLKGGGGTDFRPVFEALSNLKTRPDVVIFVTDGDGTCPVEAPKGMKVIWVLTSNFNPCEWGEHIFMDKEGM